MSVAAAVARPFRAAGGWIKGSGWPVKAGLALALVIALPLAFVVVIYLLPPSTAVALGKPVLAMLSDSPPLPDDLDPVSERSVLVANDGSELATLIDEVNRVRVSRDDLPDVFVDALLAAEDNRFYAHPGINHRAVIRAAVVNLRSGDIEQGGSTLTQQLVKNVYLDPARTARRKLTEAWYALELEDRLSKDDILERYVNETYFGQGAYGVGAAAELYFNVTVDELDAAQAATLVGIIPAPSRMNPVDSPDQARAARDRVLDRMVTTGRLSEQEARAAKSGDLALDITRPPPPEEPFFVAYVRERLLNDERFDDALGTDEEVRERTIYGGGLTIHTTLDPNLQDLATAAIDDVMGPPDESPQATLVTVQPGTGALLAMAVGPKPWGSCDDGGGSCARTQVNPTVPGLGGSGRQPGSAFKPFVLTAALSEGVPRGWEQRTAGGQEIEGCDNAGEPYEPENYSEDPGIKDMDEAITVSNNVYHAKLAGLLGPDLIIDAAYQAGLRGGQLPVQCSVALGSGSVYPLAMSESYATFASGGTHCETLVVTRIEFGRAVDTEDATFEPNCERRLPEEIATQVVDLLRGPVESGTATVADLDRPVAGKTGTTDDYRDAWFVGFVPQLATSAWIGFEQPRPLEDVLGVARVTGGSIPAQLWATYMTAAVEELEVIDFAAPPSQERFDLPDFEDSDVEDVRKEYGEDYRLNLETEEVSDYRDAGTVVGQQPDPKTEVAAGALVQLRVSDGKGEPPAVPDVVGMSEQRAREVLEEGEYKVTVEEEQQQLTEGEEPPEPERTVIRMAPDGGTPLQPGEEVVITVVVYEVVPREDDQEPTEPPDEDGEQDQPAPTQRPSPPPADNEDGDGEDEDEDGDSGDSGDSGDEPQLSPARGQVKFGRVVANPQGKDTAPEGGEYVTLVSGRQAVDVSGWSIEYAGGGTLNIGSNYVMAAGSELDVHTGPGTNRPPRRYFNRLRREVLRNGGGVLILRDDQGREVTRRDY